MPPPTPPQKLSRRTRLAGATLALSAALAASSGCSRGDRDRPQTGNLLVDVVSPLIDTESPAETARAMFDATDPDRRRRAIVRTADAPWGGDEKYVRLYRMMLGSFDESPDAEGAPDPDPTVQAAAIQALGRHGEPSDAKLIAPRLDSDSTFVRWEAAKALQRLHDPAPPVVRGLIERVTQDEDVDVRLASATALGQYPRPDVFDVLVAALSDEDYSVRHAARGSLATLTGTDQGPEASDWLDWASQHRDDMFAESDTFTYETYQPPRSMFDTLKFWEGSDGPEQHRPDGYDPTTTPAP